MMPDSNNIAFLGGLITRCGIPLISAPRTGKLGDRIGTENSDGHAYLRSAAFLRDVTGSLHAVPVRAVAFLVRLCRWRDVTRRTNVIGEILQ